MTPTIWQHRSESTLAQTMACCLMAPSHYQNQCQLIISEVQWHSSEKILEFNSLRPNDVIWWHRSRSTLAQVMACCLTTPSHYLNQCWLISRKGQWHSVEGNLPKDGSPFNHYISLKMTCLKFYSNLQGGQWVNWEEIFSAVLNLQSKSHFCPGMSFWYDLWYFHREP